MGVEFTSKQLEAITLRDCNILVSAAAGSGKTAVLTERIVRLVCDPENPVDIDRLLVLTFTSAAAAEMRERIGNKISERLSADPESEYLQRQATLLHNAQITTIDSFCLFLIRNHFQEIGLDPAFRVADEREIKLLQKEAMTELLEDAFTAAGPEFLEMVEALCPRGKEKVLEEHIQKLSDYAASFPWPEEWLEQRKKDYGETDPEKRRESAAMKYLMHYLTGTIRGLAEKLEKAISIAGQSDGPYMYADLLETEKEAVREIAEGQTIEEIAAKLDQMTFGKLSGKKDPAVSAQKREQAKKLRDEVKKSLTTVREQFLCDSPEDMALREEICRRVSGALVELVLDFDRRMEEKKRQKRLIDFSDMEHFALRILLERVEDGSLKPSPVAMQYREYFREILVDEYQDSNLVQEYLLKAISGEEVSRCDLFMVGDVKQSIYRFRLARPELFLEKYDSYRSDGPDRRIDLSQNFRSRTEVIDTVNQIFERLMSRETGGIDYDDNAALHVGAACYPPCEGLQSELLLVEQTKKKSTRESRKTEALAIAGRILELVQRGSVTDTATGTIRPVRFRDIVILLRTQSGWGEIFKEALESKGIPAYVTSKSGYFTATEVQTLLNFLRVIDNPLQDIPLFGVLKSSFGGFTEEEIAALRGAEKKGSLYGRLKACEEDRVIRFLEKLAGYREMSGYLPIRSLLERIVEDFDYLNYVTALPGGDKRRANVEMLFVKASDFEKTSYFGLFHFLRYMEMLEKYEEDYGEADTLDENADVVRIMSIHKSKGLEFPVVFVAGLSKNFNMQDVNQAVIADMDLGLGMDYVNAVRRIRGKTLQKSIVAKKLREDTLAEELRLLYVALTRAKEKLVMTALVKQEEKEDFAVSERLTYLEFMQASSYMDFLDPILPGISLMTSRISEEMLQGEELYRQIDLGIARKRLETAGETADREALARIKERLAFRYPDQVLEKLYTKTTVSELKIAAMEEKDEAAFHAFEDRESEEYIPEFKRSGEEVTGTVRGNAYHRAMELMDFEGLLGPQFAEFPADYTEYSGSLDRERLQTELTAFLHSQTQSLLLAEEYEKAVNPGKLMRFLASELGYRMWRAQRNGLLHREQPFVLAIPATRLSGEYPDGEKVLVQGIIDVYFEEEGKIILLDYKTDSVGSMQALSERYGTQLEYYTEALERLTGLPVAEKLLYSFHLESF